VRLADALGRSVSSLMDDAREEPVVVVDADDVAPLWTGPSGGTARLLLTNPRPCCSWSGDTAPRLRAGVTTAFASDVPHAYEGAGRGPCELVMTVHLPMEHRRG
jgi:hypothetical protein